MTVSHTPPAGLDRKRHAARLLLAFEQVWPASWPALGVLGGFLCAALLGLPALLPPRPAYDPVAGMVALAAAGLAWRGLHTVRWPNGAAADRRLERASGLPHRPLTALADHPAPGTGEAALWQAHVARAAASIRRLRVGLPRPGLALRDPRALRGLLLLGLVVCLGIAGADAPQRLMTALVPRFPTPAPPPAARLQAWVTPPAYTGLAPVLLAADQPDVNVPAGSRLAASLSGGPSDAPAPALSLGSTHVAFQRIDAGSWQAAADLSAGGTLSVSRGGTELGRWQMTVVADIPPIVQWPEPPSATRSRPPQLRLPWQVAHPYGVTTLHAELKLQARPEAPPLLVEVPLPGAQPRQARGARLADLTAHPWAGLPVVATLVARDTGGLTGRSEPKTILLPERRFQSAAARAVVAVRKMLALHPEDRVAAVTALDGLAGQDSVWQDDSGGYLNLRAIAVLLGYARPGKAADAAVDEAQDRLWLLALHLEEGSPARTAEILARERKAMHSALDDAQKQQSAQQQKQDGHQQQDRGTQANKDALAKREQALERALQQHLQALEQQARRDPQHATPSPQDERAAQQALEQLREALQSDKLDDAQERMAELDQALEQMEQDRRAAEQTPRQRQRAEGRQKGRQQMSVVRDLVQRETGLLDHAQARATPPDTVRDSLDLPPGQLDLGQDPSGSQQAHRDSQQRSADAEVQRALRRAVGVLMQNYGDLTGKVPQPLGDADQAMHGAENALGAGQDADAAAAAQRAIEALQKGGQSMSQQLAQMFGRGRQRGQDQGDDDGQDAEQGDGPGQDMGQGPGMELGDDGDQGMADGAQGVRRDPFGRAQHEGVAGQLDDGSETAVPETMEQTRMREIQDELRRRGAERTRPQRELEYIDRLLNTN